MDYAPTWNSHTQCWSAARIVAFIGLAQVAWVSAASAQHPCQQAKDYAVILGRQGIYPPHQMAVAGLNQAYASGCANWFQQGLDEGFRMYQAGNPASGGPVSISPGPGPITGPSVGPTVTTTPPSVGPSPVTTPGIKTGNLAELRKLRDDALVRFQSYSASYGPNSDVTQQTLREFQSRDAAYRDALARGGQ